MTTLGVENLCRSRVFRTEREAGHVKSLPASLLTGVLNVRT